MIIDQRLHTGSIIASRTFVQALALPFLVIMLLQMKRENLHGLRYRIYVTVTSCITIFSFVWLFSREEFYLKYSVLLIEVVIYGFIVLYAISNRKEFFEKIRCRNWKTIFWGALLLAMCISRYDGLWTWAFLALFIPLSILTISNKEQEIILQGMLYGIISSYFIMQGLAFIFRPYDIIRYFGLYNNTNMNALFYVIVFAAFLANQFLLTEKKSRKSSKIVNFILMISAVGFTILTMGKAALITEIILACIYLLIIVRNKQKKLKFIFIQIVLWISTSIVLLPICYITARYLPPLFHHSVWFYGEYSEQRVHSYDAYNSEKYPYLETIADSLLGRYSELESLFMKKTTQELDLENTIQGADALDINKEQDAESVNNEIENKDEELLADGSDAMHPLYRAVSVGSSSSIRIKIWKEYLHRINYFGHTKEEPHFWLTEDYYVLHAHNLFLEFTYDFGIIIGILFFLGYAISAISQFILAYKTKSSKEFIILIMLLILGVFGMFELDWYVGQAPLTLFFFMLCITIWDKKIKKKALIEGDNINENKDI